MTEALFSRTASSWRAGVAIFLFGLVPPIAYLAPLGFAPLMALVGLLALPGVGARRPAARPMLVLVLLVGWAALSLLWSPAAVDPATLKTYGDVEAVTALKLALQLAAYGAAVIGLRAVSDESARRTATLLAYGAIGLAVLVAVDGLSGAAIYQSLRDLIGDPIRPDLAKVKVSISTYVLALLFWPAAHVLAARGRRGAAALLLAATVAAAATMSSDASLAGLGLGLAAWLLVGKGGPAGGRILVGLVAAPFILAPLAVLFGVQTGVWGKLHQWVPASWDARLDIWAFAADKIQAHPIRGWGLDASRTFGLAIPLHTHNAQLQLWLELGAVGAALAGVFFCWLAYGLSRLSVERRGEAAMGAGALVTFLTIGGLSFGVWQEWWLALGALTVIACEMARRGVQRDYVEELALVD